ncbi:MAG: hydroxymethylglutaryl-CoA synthase family protein [Minisyncoccales bacterium]
MEIGISEIGIALPKYFLSSKELAKKRKLDPFYSEKGIGVFENRILFQERLEELAIKALKKINTKGTERFFFATESDPDASKPLGVKILSSIGQKKIPFQLKFACLAGLEAVILACEYVYLHKKPAIILAFDRSFYSSKNPKAELTQGAAAIALKIEKNPKILSFKYKKIGQFSQNLDDFKVPFSFFPFPQVNGELTKPVYLLCLRNALNDWKEKEKKIKNLLEYFDFFVMHAPFPKIVEWASAIFWRHEKEKKHLGLETCLKNPHLFNVYKREIDLIREKEEFKKFFQKKVMPSLKYNPYIGNSYTCSIFVSLLSVLEKAKKGDKIALAGYGSGAGAIFLEAKVKKNFKSDLNLQIKKGKKISILDYEKWRKKFFSSYNKK